MLKICILTEGGMKYGFGHISRCTAIYDAFTSLKFKPQFLIHGDNSINAVIKNKKVKTYNWIENNDKLFKYIKNASIIVVDSYHAIRSLYDKISSSSAICLYLDDTKRINYPKGYLLNAAPFVEIKYPQKQGMVYLIGPKYALLRKEFWDTKKKKIHSDVSSALITLGGADKSNLILKIIKVLNNYFFEKKIIINKNHPYLDEIKKHQDKKTKIISNVSVSQMKQIMQESDLAVSAGGQALFELARMGVPTIAVATANNQLANINGLLKGKSILSFNKVDKTNFNQSLINSIETLKAFEQRKIISKNAQKLFDGQGALRIVRLLLKKYFIENLNIRRAELKDMKRIFELSNNKVVRNHSFNNTKISWAEHRQWFQTKIKNKKCLFLIAEIEGKLVGQIRFNIKVTNAPISISINKEFRQKGIGQVMMEKSIPLLKKEIPHVNKIIAFVKENNDASQKYFEKCNFKLNKKLKINGTPSYEYCYKLKSK